VLVTLRDRQHRAVRDAVVSIGKVAHANPAIAGLQVGFSNRSGQAAFLLPLTKSLLGKRLRLQIVARTPATHVRTVTTFVVDKAHPRPKKRLALGAQTTAANY